MFEYLVFYEYQSYEWSREVRIEVDGDSLRYRFNSSRMGFPNRSVQEGVYPKDYAQFISKLEACHINQWQEENSRQNTGYGWSLRYKEVGKPCIKIKGTGISQVDFCDFLHLINDISDAESEKDRA